MWPNGLINRPLGQKNMDLSTLTAIPTDNLYKFMSIVGMIIFLFAITVPEWFRRKNTFQAFEIRRDHEINKILNEEIGREIEESKAELNALKETPIGSKTDPINIKEALSEISKKMTEVQIQDRRINCELDKLGYLKDRIRYLKYIQLTLVCSSLVLLSFGFYLWYIKLQAYLDIAVQTGISKP